MTFLLSRLIIELLDVKKKQSLKTAGCVWMNSWGLESWVKFEKYKPKRVDK